MGKTKENFDGIKRRLLNAVTLREKIEILNDLETAVNEDQKDLEAYKIVKEKLVDVKLVALLDNAYAYNNFGTAKRTSLTDSEFKSVKEGL